MARASQHDRGIFGRLLREIAEQRLNLAQRKRKRDAFGSDKRQPALLIFGAGAQPGIGAAIAARCAAEGMHAFISGRNAAKVETTAQAIRDAGGRAQALTVDVRDPNAIADAFATVREHACRLELVVHNVGTNRPTPFLDIRPEALEKRWISDCRSGFLIGQQAVSCMLEQADSERGRGTIIFTGASASLRGRAGFAAFAQAKAGLRMLAQAMAREFGPEGIHVAHTIIDGVVDGDRLRRSMPEYLKAQGEQGCLDPAAIAENYWTLAQQHRCAWTQELDLRPSSESW
nr:SDR family NAD(P)-dependent oxidoreductase [Oceanococcus sp. HetDA_MAG_MS8]